MEFLVATDRDRLTRCHRCQELYVEHDRATHAARVRGVRIAAVCPMCRAAQREGAPQSMNLMRAEHGEGL